MAQPQNPRDTDWVARAADDVEAHALATKKRSPSWPA